MLTDISKSIKAAMYERVTSPLSGTFAIAWAVWNYKIILALFSSFELQEKIAFIDNVLYPDILTIVLTGFICPLSSAVIFIIVYPIPARWAYEYWSNNQKKLKEIKQEIEDDILLTLEESREIKRALFKLESEHDEQLKSKNAEIEYLKQEIAQSGKNTQSESDFVMPDGKMTFDDLNKGEKKLLMEIYHSGGIVVPIDQILTESVYGETKANYYLKALESKGYVRRQYDEPLGTNVITLTERGHRFADSETFA